MNISQSTPTIRQKSVFLTVVDIVRFDADAWPEARSLKKKEQIAQQRR